MKKENYMIKTHEADTDKFAELVVAAKGSLSMKAFAELCGVTPSTITRIVNKSNKGASTPELINAIFENANPQSGVTMEALAHANGYTVKNNTDNSAQRIALTSRDIEFMGRDILINELISRGAEFSMGFPTEEMKHLFVDRADFEAKTNVFADSEDIWHVEFLNVTPTPHFPARSLLEKKALEKVSRYVFFTECVKTIQQITRFSLVVFDRSSFDAMIRQFSRVVVPTDITFILINFDNYCIEDEYVLPHKEKGQQPSYFMTTPRKFGSTEDGFYEEEYFEERRDEDDKI